MTHPTPDLFLLEHYDDISTFLDWVDTRPGAIAIDTETTGLKWWTPRFTRLVQFSDGVSGWAVPTEWWGRVVTNAMQSVRDSGRPVVFHNAAFDMHALEGDGFPVPEWYAVHDTAVMCRLIAPHMHAGLKPVTERRFGAWATAGQNLLKRAFKDNGWDWATVPVDLPEYWAYGVMDTFLTHLLYMDLTPELQAGGLIEAYNREMHALSVMYRAETRGMRVDPKWAEQLRAEWRAEAGILAMQLEQAGIKNPNSNRQLSTLFKERGWEPTEFTEKGNIKLDKVILGQLSEVYGDVAPQVLRFKRITKWATVYLDKFIDDRDPRDRVHPGINTMQARTGRMSITNPPLQTLPSKDGGPLIRRCILPSKGSKLYAIDYQGQEARLFAHYSQDPGMLEALRSGTDLYTHAARVIYQDPSITKDHRLRSLTKVLLLAFTYGAGVDTLADQSGMTGEQTYAFLLRLFEAFPNVRTLTGDHSIGGNYPGEPSLSAQARLADEGLAYTRTSGGRRFVTWPDELYKHVNGIMQGSGADVLKSAIIRLDKAGLGDNIVVPVHDELLFEFPEEEGDTMAAEAATLMTDHSFSVPLDVDVTGPMDNWGQAYEKEEKT